MSQSTDAGKQVCNARYLKSYGPHYRVVRPDYARCAEGVSGTIGWGVNQCSRKRGYGPDEAYCKQHAKNKEVR